MKRLLLTLVLVAAAGAAAALALAHHLDARGIPARRLANYVEGRQQGHNGVIVAIGDAIQTVLYAATPAPPPFPDLAGWPVGVRTLSNAVPASARRVSDVDGLRQALAQANPGDVVVLQAGRYRIEGEPLPLNRPGTADAPITLRGTAGAQLLVNVREALVVTAPWWRIEGLDVQGRCASDSDCDHAFHIDSGASHFYAADNWLHDFNAHIKINGTGARFPDDGVIEHNTLSNADVRHTSNAVTPIDLVGASGWHIRGNLISDFIKGEGDQISYGAYAKGAGSANVFSYNVVWCEHKLRGQPGARVGLSFGGGGSGPSYCRDQRCVVEQEGGVMESNLVASCSDDGIYLNNAANSRISNNSVLGTTGMSLRFAGSSAAVDGNLLDGPVRVRDGALLREGDNVSAPAGWGLLGGRLENSVAAAPRRRASTALPPDLCAQPRGREAAYGAIDHIGACRAGSARP
jgi:parallel beta-helix repeat protein